MLKRIPTRLVWLLALLGLVLVVRWFRQGSAPATGTRAVPGTSAGPGTADAGRLAGAVLELEAREERLAQEHYAKELLALRCGRLVEDAWDRLKRSSERMGEAARLVNCPVILPVFGAPEAFPLGVELRSRASGERVSPGEWAARVAGWAREGWAIEQVELRHVAFRVGGGGAPESSDFTMALDLTNRLAERRLAFEGRVRVDWGVDGGVNPVIEAVDVLAADRWSREGAPLFSMIAEDELRPPKGSFFIDPLLVEDLDRDGTNEVVLAAANTFYRRLADGRYERRALSARDPGLLFTAVLGDFDGDGFTDLLGARFQGLFLCRGSAAGRFEGPWEQVWAVRPHLKFGQVLASGDVDGDGDLDLFLGQYRVPYHEGQMPTPYDDANDGNPSWLLLNLGGGRFEDATAASGLEAKRHRRVYSGSFVDVDEDGDLDLVTVSDFAGADLFLNDGRGRFADRTRALLGESAGFGMAHAWSDFDGDGRSDLLMIGMNSPTADRLASLGLVRPGVAGDGTARGRVTHGNRLWVRDAAGGFQQGGLGDSLAHSGWSWGVGVLDFDNDGFADVYVANGHETGESVQDYESEFWRHDLYVAGSKPDPVVNGYFGAKMSRTRGRGWSYGGNERNRLFWNRDGRRFVPVGHLAGVALGEDCRNVVADDLDRDGRVDLVVTTFRAWPRPLQTVRIYRNQTPGAQHWIGVRWEGGLGSGAVGTRVVVHGGGRGWERQWITGDSYRAQHSLSAHFGLGPVGVVDRIELLGPGGRRRVLERPGVDRWIGIEGFE